MKIIAFFSFLFLLPILLFSQSSQFFYENRNDFKDHKLVLDQEGDNIKVIEGNSVFHLNDNGQVNTIEKLPFDFDSNSFGTFFYKKTAQKEIFAIYTRATNEVIIYSFIGDSRDLSVTGSWTGSYKAASLAYFLGGPGLIEKEDGNLVLMDRTYFQVIDGDNGNLLLEAEGNARQPSQLLKTTDGYLVPAAERPYISAIGEDGTLLWRKEYDHLENFNQLLENEGGYFAIAETDGSFDNGILLKLNSELDTIWTKRYAGYSFRKMILTNDGGLALTGQKERNTSILKLSQEGVIEWEQTYDFGTGWDLAEQKDGSFIIAAHDGFNLQIIKTNKVGEISGITNNYFSNKAILDVNNIRNTFYSDGIHADAEERDNGIRNDSTGAYLSTFHDSGLWIGGVTTNGDLHFSGVKFGSDFQGGLIDDNHPFYQQVWQVNRRDIETFKEKFKPGIAKKEEIPYNLLKYPAKGNPFATDFEGNPFVVDKALAPFVDIDGDSIYNPLNGDFPLIKGDKQLFWVMHDNTPHELSNGIGLGVNVFCKAYAYHKPTIPTVHNTIFVDMEIVNESNRAYSNVNLGLYSDLDIGCPNDDYIGAYPNGDFFYAYNRNQVDNQCLGSDEFKEELPIQTILFLNKKLDRFQYFLRGDTAPIPGMRGPSYSNEYYNLSTVKFVDGTPLSLGGFGYNADEDATLTDYAFPGNPADGTTWSMCRAELPRIDVRGLGVSGPHALAPGEKLTLSVAHTFFPDVPHPCPDITPIASALEPLKTFHQTGYYGTEGILTSSDTISKLPTPPNSSSRIIRQPINTSLKVYPIPAKEYLQVAFESTEIAGEVSYRMLNHLGQEVFYQQTKLERDELDYFPIDVNHLQAGVYTFYAMHRGKMIAVKRVLIF